MFEVQMQGDTAVVTPQKDLREFDFGEIELEGTEILRLLDSRTAPTSSSISGIPTTMVPRP